MTDAQMRDLTNSVGWPARFAVAIPRCVRCAGEPNPATAPAWFAAEVVTGAGQAGLAERVLDGAQAVWPLTVVLSCRHSVRVAVGPTAYAA